MGFWNKLGQIALQAAPYVAAPFTGGMSLMAAPMTGNLANKLEDKADRETFEKTGVAPSRNMMNKIMGGVNTAAGIYGGAKLGGKFGGGGDGGGGISNLVGNNSGGGGGGLMDFVKQYGQQQLGGGSSNLGGIGGFGGMMNTLAADGGDSGGGNIPSNLPSGMGGSAISYLPNTGGKEIPGVAGWRGESFPDFATRNPNLSDAIARGKKKAISPSGM